MNSDGDGKRYLFDNPRNVRLVVRGLSAICVLLVGIELVVHRHLAHEWESLFGFYALYGFVACVLLVLLAAEMRKLVMRDEDEDRPTQQLRIGRLTIGGEIKRLVMSQCVKPHRVGIGVYFLQFLEDIQDAL